MLKADDEKESPNFKTVVKTWQFEKTIEPF